MIFKQTFGEIKCPSLQYSSDYERHQDSKLLKSAVNLSDEVFAPICPAQEGNESY